MWLIPQPPGYAVTPPQLPYAPISGRPKQTGLSLKQDGRVQHPTTWTFDLDARATHVSLTSTADGAIPIFATPETVDQAVASFAHTTATPQDVVALLELSRKLLRTSVVHYEFAAIAVEKSLQALERGLRLRLGTGDRVRFKDLIDRASREGLIGAPDVELFDTARQLRNFFAHPSTSSALPLVMVTAMLDNAHRFIALLFRETKQTT